MLKSINFQTLEQMEEITLNFPVQMRNEQGQVKTARNKERYDELIEDGFAVVEEKPANAVNRARSSEASKKPISFEEAKKLADKNISEALAIPSAIVDKGDGYTFAAKVVGYIQQVSRRTKSEFPSTQVEANGTKFCILFDAAKDALGNVLNLKVQADEEGVSRSGFVLVRV